MHSVHISKVDTEAKVFVRQFLFWLISDPSVRPLGPVRDEMPGLRYQVNEAIFMKVVDRIPDASLLPASLFRVDIVLVDSNFRGHDVVMLIYRTMTENHNII